jgi:hypothetical protein
MPVLGNHDRQDGLGAKLYYDLFSLPKNAPEKVEPEGSYSFEYGNALFLMIDATSEVDAHTAWIEAKLSETKATGNCDVSFSALQFWGTIWIFQK